MDASSSDPPVSLPNLQGRRLGRSLRECLETVRRRWRSLRLVEGVGLVGAAIAVLVTVLFALDNLQHLSGTARLVLLLLAVAAVGGLGLRYVLIQPFRPFSDEECALLIERGHANLQDRLLNTVYFARREHGGFERAVVDLVAEEAEVRLVELPRRGILGAKRALWLSAYAGLAWLTVLLYAAVFPEHFQNAAARFTRPFSDVQPLTHTRLQVEPGDVELRAGETLTVRVETEGVLPEAVTLTTSAGTSITMEFDGRRFEYRIATVGDDFTYRVEAGDALSREYLVRVIRPPEVRSLDIVVIPPDYASLPPREEKGSSGNIDALQGSRIRLEVHGTKPLKSAWWTRVGGDSLEMERLAASHHAVTIELDRDVEYGFFLTDEDGNSSPQDGPRRRLRSVPDLPPRVELLEPGRDLDASSSLASSLAVSFRADDDVGLASAVLLVAPEAEAEAEDRWRPARTWDEIRGKREATLSVGLDFWRLAGKLGTDTEVVLYRAVVRDLFGNEATSRTFRVRIIEQDPAIAKATAALERFQGDLATVLRREQALERSTVRELEEGGATGSGDERTAARDRIASLAEEQYAIRTVLLSVLRRLDGSSRGVLPPEVRRPATEDLLRAAEELMPSVALQLRTATSQEGDSRRHTIDRARQGELEIIEVLSAALGSIERLLRTVRSGESLETDPSARLAALRGVGEKLRGLLGDIQQFNREQKEVLARSRALEDRLPEDFTTAELEELQDLVATEEKWGRILDEKATDLSKVLPQDMSLGNLSEEIVELVEEIDLARNYLEGKNVELAVPVEQSGVALSEKLETNIERWLLRDRDRLKWVMEEATELFDVPLADLPSELEDIVGELIDQEELMTEQTEDVTSSWLDSMDDGIGWDAMDGPISNMSAKGVTGNLQPNDMEIGGRSGEGRSGKSQGQFVEETATGKGGRQTPTRSTPDPFEAGEVKDTGQDPQGGSTGGGKLSGAGAEGLRGAPSPELDRKMGALAERQVGIREGAEKLDLALQKRRFYPQNLERALQLMRNLESELIARRPIHYENVRREIVSELRHLQRSVSDEIERKTEERSAFGLHRDSDLENASGEEIPKEFQDLIREYYGSLGRGSPRPDDRDEGGERP